MHHAKGVCETFCEHPFFRLVGKNLPKCVIVVDNSNIFIEGQKYSAVLKKVKPAAPGGKLPCDPSWRVDFLGLLNSLADGREIESAILVGSRPPANDRVWREAELRGFEVLVFDRDGSGKEKCVDTALVARGVEIICCASEPMALILASGDRDFIPLVQMAQKRSWTVEMAAFSSAFTGHGEMATTVDKVRPLDSMFAQIGHNAFEWPIPVL